MPPEPQAREATGREGSGPLVVAQWSRLGPYHLARLRAAHAHLRARGGDVVAMETASNDAVYAWDLATATEPFLRVQIFPGETYETLPPRRIVAGVLATLDRLDPDAVVINSYSAPDAQAALLWCRRRRRVAVCLMESKADDAERTPLREWIKARLVGEFDAALAGGTPQREYLRQLGFPPDAVFFTCDAVDNAFFQQGADAARRAPGSVRHLRGLGDPAPFFLASNRFVDRKNLDTLVRAYGLYRDRAPGSPWRLLLLGDGPTREALERLVLETSVEGVTFAGFRQIDELPAYYGLAAAFVHPAFVEQWGLVVNEALAAGLPVVVSERVGAARDLVRPGQTGLLFDPTSVEDLADRLTQMAALPTAEREAMGRQGQVVVDAWSPEQFARGLWDAIDAGRARADRGPDPVARAILAAIWTVSRRVGSYGAISE